MPQSYKSKPADLGSLIVTLSRPGIFRDSPEMHFSTLIAVVSATIALVAAVSQIYDPACFESCQVNYDYCIKNGKPQNTWFVYNTLVFFDSRESRLIGSQSQTRRNCCDLDCTEQFN